MRFKYEDRLKCTIVIWRPIRMEENGEGNDEKEWNGGQINHNQPFLFK